MSPRLCLLVALMCCAHAALVPITLRAAVVNQPPFALLTQGSGSARATSVVGLFPELFRAILTEAGYAVTMTFDVPPDGESGSLVNGTWTGAMLELVEGRADCFLGSMSISASRLNAVQFATPLHQNTLAVLINQPQSLFTIWAFFLPFAVPVWGVLLATAFFMAAAMFVVDALSPFGSRSSPDPAESAKAAPRELLFQSFLTLVANNKGGETTRGTAARILNWFYCFFALIVVATYTASLASFFVLSSAPPALASVDDLRRLGVPFAVVLGSNAASFFQQPAYAAALPNMISVRTFEEGIAGVRNKSWVGFVSTRTQLEYYANQPPCDQVVVGQSEDIGPVMIGLTFANRSATFMNEVSLATLRLEQSGVIQSLWKRVLFDLQSECTVPPPTGQVTLTQLQGLWYVLLMGLGLALVVLVCERIFVHYLRRHKGLAGIAQATMGSEASAMAGQDEVTAGARLSRRVSQHFAKFLGGDDGVAELASKGASSPTGAAATPSAVNLSHASPKAVQEARYSTGMVDL